MQSICGHVSHLGQLSIRGISTSSRVLASHYDILGITKAATQADIKASYYKLSKLYHPDVNSDAEAAIKFRAITTAYEVLGNVKLKKLYDRGVYYDATEPEVDSTPLSKFHRSREYRHKVPSEINDSIYDYDAWVKEHYGATFDRTQKEKTKRSNIRATKAYHTDLTKREISIVTIIFIIILTVGSFRHVKDLDVDKTASK